MAYKRLGDVLIDAGLITEDQLGHALKQQKETKRRLGDELIAEASSRRRASSRRCRCSWAWSSSTFRRSTSTPS